MPSSTGIAWQKLSEALNLRERLAGAEPVVISANEIKAVSGREPRLMTKFDTRESRPPELANVTILPLTNGTYALLSGDGYANVPDAFVAKHWPAPSLLTKLATLPWVTGPASESQALDMANAAGILSDFTQDPGACLTIRGRLRSPRFEFQFRSASGALPLLVDGVQIEVDAGFEGTGIHLVEAKLGTRTNFHIRQLYYPYRMWHALVAIKRVSALFLSFSNRCFSLRSFAFEPVDSYHALVPVAATDYYLDEPRRLPSLAELLDTTLLEPVPAAIPFPQADDARRVIDVVDAVVSGLRNRAEIAARYDFDERQADYYANAAAFLGFLKRTQTGFELSELGARFSTLTFSERHTLFLCQIARRPVFRETIQKLCESGALPASDEVAEMIARTTGLGGKTPSRRARTVLSWARWIESLLKSDTVRGSASADSATATASS